jgi:FtsP/CotA-like multicopper oxidase with cupredoxin domain
MNPLNASSRHSSESNTEIEQAGGDMNESQPTNGTSVIGRRTLLRGGAAVALGAAAGGLLMSRGGAAHAGTYVSAKPASYVPPSPNEQQLHLAATDGWVSMPGTAPKIKPFWPDPYAPDGYNTYVFGFRNVTSLSYVDLTPQVQLIKNQAQISAPILGFDQYQQFSDGTDNAIRITLSNLGLAQRPDLVDGHTLHWHGFNNAIPLFDGVPELSIAVPIGRSFTYYYRAHDPGTYMYHCHFEDVEHVQMGMTGLVYVRPAMNTPTQKFAYNHSSTAYDREFTYMLTELWAEAHFRDAHIQTTDWTDYKPTFWLMNGRAYPDTLKPTTDPLDPGPDPTSDSGMSLRFNPIGSLVTCAEGDRVLLRMSNLGYQQHSMTVDGITLRVVAKDANALVDSNRDVTYETNTVEIGPGESRDVIFVAPKASSTATAGNPDVYRLYDRNYAYASNGGGAGYGGMLTEIHVSPAGTVPPQSGPNT